MSDQFIHVKQLIAVSAKVRTNDIMSMVSKSANPRGCKHEPGRLCTCHQNVEQAQAQTARRNQFIECIVQLCARRRGPGFCTST